MPRPDDGLIHTWLDGQLPPDEGAQVEQLVETDAEWAAAAAEARGLIAASSRILSALDLAPAGVVLPTRPMAPAPRRLPWWTKAAAAVLLIAGASTLMLRRTPEPKIVRATQTTKSTETAVTPSAPTGAPTTTAAPPAVTKRVQLTRRPTAGVVAGGSGEAPNASTPNAPAPNAPAPNAPASLPALGALAPSLAVQQGVVADQRARIAVASEQATRQQRTDEARQGVTQVLVQRTAAETVAAKAFAARDAAGAAAPAPAAKVVGGVAKEVRVPFPTHPGACYRLDDSRTSVEVGTVMRIGRTNGDTLHLESVQVPSPLRAWVVLRDGTARGVLTTEPEGRGMILVTARPVSCPVP
jgi:hypothetical protein